MKLECIGTWMGLEILARGLKFQGSTRRPVFLSGQAPLRNTVEGYVLDA
jgi:hypothetical protein